MDPNASRRDFLRKSGATVVLSALSGGLATKAWGQNDDSQYLEQ
jgi:hypothetical protein